MRDFADCMIKHTVFVKKSQFKKTNMNNITQHASNKTIFKLLRKGGGYDTGNPNSQSATLRGNKKASYIKFDLHQN